MKDLIVLSAHCEPLPTSAASHMCDIAEYFAKSRRVYFITQTKFAIGRRCKYGIVFGIRNPFLKSENLYFRFLGELISPLILAITFGVYCRLFVRSYDVIAYSPTALQFPLMGVLKCAKARQLLILRDIFPLWLADANRIERKSRVFQMLEKLSAIQYKLSDVIGVQCIDDVKRLDTRFKDKCKVLNSFYSEVYQASRGYHKLNSRFIEVGCFGTFGDAQGWREAVPIINQLLNKHGNLRFSFYGSNNKRLKKECFSEKVRKRVFIQGPVLGAEFARLLQRMDVGFFSLAKEISCSNVPGKFVNYCKYKLPTFALCDPESHVAQMIETNRLGIVANISNFDASVSQFSKFVAEYQDIDKTNIYKYFLENHSVAAAAERIDGWLSGN